MRALCGPTLSVSVDCANSSELGQQPVNSTFCQLFVWKFIRFTPLLYIPSADTNFLIRILSLSLNTMFTGTIISVLCTKIVKIAGHIAKLQSVKKWCFSMKHRMQRI